MNLKPIFGVILTLILGSTSFANPQEKTQSTVNRDTTVGNSVRTELTMNVFKKEAYQAEYKEQVPYQAQETYYVDVPYQVEETYYVDVPYQVEETYYVDIPYQTTETYTERIPYTERVPYTDYEEYYDNEYVCRNTTKYREECHNQRKCEPGREVCQPVTECGTNVHGERICKTRNVCRDEGPRDCREVRECRQVPYDDRVCNYERVRKTRTVTKYREETRYRNEQRTRTVTKYRQEARTRTITKYRKEERTRTVTKHRQEARTRTVTKYREETRCCVTKYRDVFDHQFTQPVTVIFPAQAQLIAGETEKVQMNLRGTENNPEISINVTSNIYNYEVEQTRLEGREKVFILKLVAKWTEQNAGATTIQGLKLSFSKGQGAVVFKETVTSPRLTTIYNLEVRDLQSQTLVAQGRLEGTKAKTFEMPVPALARDGKYSISLHVERQGINVAQGLIKFDLNSTYEKKELDQEEIQSLRNAKLVELLAIEGEGAERIVLFQDQTPAIEEISTTYKLVVWKKLAGGKIDWLGEKSFSRESISRPGNELGISLKDIGVNPAVGTKIYMDLVVTRHSEQYLGSQKVQFVVNKTF